MTLHVRRPNTDERSKPFKTALTDLRDQGNYREFANLEGHRGTFTKATSRGVETADVTIWCFNDYLGMGQHPDVLAAMHDALRCARHRHCA